MRVRYRFEDVIEQTVQDFCAVALPGVRLPEEAVYGIESDRELLEARDTSWAVIDGSRIHVSCSIETPEGPVSLFFSISWWDGSKHVGRDESDDLPPEVDGLRALWNVEDYPGHQVTLRWNAGLGSWTKLDTWFPPTRDGGL